MTDVIAALKEFSMGNLAAVKADILAAATLFAFVLGFFTWLDKYASEAAKARITKWLMTPRSSAFNIAELFASLFALVYGNKICSFRGFFRSALATTIVCVIIAFIWTISNFQSLDFSGDLNYFDDTYYFSVETLLVNFIFYLFVFSIPADYVALLISSVAIKKSAVAPSIWRAATVLALGYIACALAYFLALVILVTLQPEASIDLTFFPEEGFSYYVDLLTMGLTFDPLIILAPGSGPSEFIGTFGPFAYSTFFVLSWYILFVFTALTLKLIILGTKSVSFLTWLFDVDNYPLTCIGAVAATITAAVYLGAMVFLS